ncbi:MAG: hypothetical protein DRQ47_00090 [Gammaproteobacteria bacterium]|nr:MAG: hypothetical protein DRQ47_00090 [Gammaproteobacteria bacterium]
MPNVLKAAFDSKIFSCLFLLALYQLFASTPFKAEIKAEKVTTDTQTDLVSKTPAINSLQMKDFLETGTLVSFEDTELGITQPQRITLAKNNLQIRAIFKSFSTKIKITKGRSRTKQLNSADRFENDAAAYHLDQILEMNMVPTTIIRTINNNEGAVQAWVENSIVLKDIYESKSTALEVCPFKKQQAMMDVFDILIHNDDRNLGNVLYTLEDCKLWMIDHSRAFRIKNTAPRNLKSITIRLSEEFAKKLNNLDYHIIHKHLGDFITRSQIRSLLYRRDLILNHWEKSGKLDFLAG